MEDMLQIVGGLLMLIAGGEGLVRGAVSVANRLSIPVVVIGLTIVAMGTSAPEMVVSIMAVLEGHPDIALGNVIGSNIANVLLVLGVTALIYPIKTNPDITKRDGILMVLVSVLMFVFMSNNIVSRLEGIVLLAILVGYLANMFRLSRRKAAPEILQEFEEETQYDYGWLLSLALLSAGFVLLIFGADILVDGASDMARAFGVSEGVIAATIVAIGTSAPELVTCGVAAYRRHSDIAVGNVIGSNLFNICAVLAAAAIVHPVSVLQQFLEGDIFVMLVSSTLLIPLMMSDKKISRTEGGVMFSWYILYILYQYHLVTS